MLSYFRRTRPLGRRALAVLLPRGLRQARHQSQQGPHPSRPGRLLHDARKTSVDRAEDFVCQHPQMVFESSGTTGKNKRVYYSENELRAGGQIHGRRI